MNNQILIQLLGTGTCVPLRERNSAAYWVGTGDNSLLLDIGSGCLRRLVEAGRDYRDLDAIGITHFHPDHCSDLAPLLLALQYTPGFRRTKPLRLFGPPGLKEHLELLADLYGDWLRKLSFPIQTIEMENDTVRFDSVEICAAPAKHGLYALSYRLNFENGCSLTYSGDTGFSNALIALADRTDLLIVECSAPTPMEGHLTPREVGEIAAAADCRKVVLSHFYPLYAGVDPVAVVRKYYQGEVIAGTDFQVFHLEKSRSS